MLNDLFDNLPVLPSLPAGPTIPHLFRRRSVNFIVGDASSGRLRLALTQLNNYAALTNPMFLDKPVHTPAQLGCVLCKQDKNHILDMITEMQLDNLSRPGAFPISRWYSFLADEDEPWNNFPLLTPYRELCTHKLSATEKTAVPPPRFLLIENLQLLLASGKVNDQKPVAIFMDLLQEFCNRRDCTILGILPTPKAGGGYTSLIHKIMGSVQWGEAAATIIAIDEARASSRNGLTPLAAERYRVVTVKAPGNPLERHWMLFDDCTSRLNLTAPPEPLTSSGQAMLDQMLAVDPPGTRYKMVDLVSWGKEAAVSARTVRRWVESCVKFKFLAKEGSTVDTIYVKIDPPMN